MTTFDDETFNFLSSTATAVNEPGEIISPWAGKVEPQGFPAPLNIVDGGRARGTWTLRTLDDTNGDVGTLNCFKIRIKPETSSPASGIESGLPEGHPGWGENQGP